MCWNYRILRYPDGTLALHEVYYDDDGRPELYTEKPIHFAVDADEGPEDLIEALENALSDAREYPVLDRASIGTTGKAPGRE